MARTPKDILRLRAAGYYSRESRELPDPQNLLAQPSTTAVERPSYEPPEVEARSRSFIGPPVIGATEKPSPPSFIGPPIDSSVAWEAPERSRAEWVALARAEEVGKATEHRERLSESGEFLPEWYQGRLVPGHDKRNALRLAARAAAETGVAFTGGTLRAVGKGAINLALPDTPLEDIGVKLMQGGQKLYDFRARSREATFKEIYDEEGQILADMATNQGVMSSENWLQLGNLVGAFGGEGLKYYGGGQAARKVYGNVAASLAKRSPKVAAAITSVAGRAPRPLKYVAMSRPVQDVLAFLPVDFITTQEDEDAIAYAAEMFTSEEFRESFKEDPDKAWGLFSGDRGQRALEVVNKAASEAMADPKQKLLWEGTFGFAADLTLRTAGKALKSARWMSESVLQAARDPAGVSGLDPSDIVRSTDDVEMHLEARMVELSNRVETLKEQRLKRDVEGGESVEAFDERRGKHWEEIRAAEAKEAAAWDEFRKADVNITESADEAVERGVDGEQKLKGRPQREQPPTNEEKYYYLDDPESVERMGPIERRIEDARAWMLRGDKPYDARPDDTAEEVFFREHPAITRAVGPTLAGATLGVAAPAETTEERIGNMLKGATLTAGILHGSKQLVDVATGAKIVDPNTLITGVPPTKPPSAKDAIVKPVKDTMIHGLMDGSESLLDAANRRIIQGSKHLISEVGWALKERAEKLFGGRTLDISHDGRTLKFTNEEDVDKVVKMGIEEVVRALSKEGNAIEWYQADLDEAYSITMRHLHGKHGDKVLKDGVADPDIVEGLRVSVALMSDGQAVKKNLDQAVKQMDYYIENGVFSVELGTGNNARKMNSNFAIVNDLIERRGKDSTYRFLNSEVTVRELKDAGFKVGGELMDQKVKASAIFGPKVGGAFFPNVGGDLDPLTMDRWFTRWLGRLTGNIMADPSESTKAKGRESLLKALRKEKIDFNPKVDADGKELTPDEQVARITAKAREIHKEWEAKWRASDKDNRPTKPEFVKKAQTHIGHVDGVLRDSPSSGGEREGNRKIMRMIQEGLEADGHGRHEIATLQALVWFPEKELYAKLGVPVTEDWTFSSAAKDLFGDLESIPIKQETLDGTAREVHDPRSPDELTRIREESFRGLAGKGATPYREGLDEKSLRGRDGFLTKSTITHRRAALIRRRESQGVERNFDGGLGDTPKRLLGEGAAGRVSSTQVWRATKGVEKEWGNLIDRPDLYEVKDGQVFRDMIEGAMKEHPTGSSVHMYESHEYNNMRLFLTDDGKAGYALNGDDIVSVFKAPGAEGTRGWTAYALTHAVEMGGRRLDAYDTDLPELYAMGGFEAFARTAFNDEFAPAGWDPKQYSQFRGLHGEAGKPDIVTMVYNPRSTGKYKRSDGQVYDDYGEMLEATAEYAKGGQRDLGLDDTRVNVGAKKDFEAHSSRTIGGGLAGAGAAAIHDATSEEKSENLGSKMLTWGAAAAGVTFASGRLKGVPGKPVESLGSKLKGEEGLTAADEFVAAVKKEMEAENVTIETGRKVEPPTKGTTPSLPPALSKAAPRYRSASLKFESDIDRAAYIVRNRDKRSQSDQKYVEWLEANGVSETEAVELGNKIANSLKGLYEDGAEEIVVAADADMNARFLAPPAKSVDSRAAEDIDPNEFVNVKKIVGDGGERLEKRIEQEVRNVVVRHNMDPKLVVTHAETIAAAESLGLSAYDISSLLAEGKVSGVELLAARNIMNETSERIVDLYEFISKRGDNLTEAERAATYKEIDLLEADEDSLFRTYMPAASEVGRMMNSLKIAARNRMDAATWIKRATKVAGVDKLPDGVLVEIRKLTKAHKDDPSNPKHKQALLELMQEMYEAPISEQLVAWTKAAMLSALSTYGVNVVGTGVNLAFRQLLANPAANLVDRFVAFRRGTPRTKHWGSAQRQIQAARIGAKKGVEAFWAIWRGEGNIEETLQRLDAGHRNVEWDLFSRGANALSTKLQYERALKVDVPAKVDRAMNIVMQTVFRGLGSMDQYFSEIAVRMSLDEQARVMALNEGLTGQALLDRADEILAKETSPQMMAEAVEAAALMAFRNKGPTAEVTTGIKRGLKRRATRDYEDSVGGLGSGASFIGWIASEVIAPFPFTPSNVLERTIEMTPLNLVIKAFDEHAWETALGIATGTNKGKSKKELLKQRKLAESLGATAAGTLSFVGLGILLYEAGIISPPYEPGTYGQSQVTGIPSNSFRVHGQWVDATRISPAGGALLMGAQIAAAYDPTREEIIYGEANKIKKFGLGTGMLFAEMFASQARIVSEMSVMDNFQRVLETFDRTKSDRGLERGVLGLSRIPPKMMQLNILRRLRRSFDPQSYQVETATDEFRNMLKGGKFWWEKKGEGLARRIDPLGQPIKMGGGSEGKTGLWPLVDPFNTARDLTDDPVRAMFRDLDIKISPLRRDRDKEESAKEFEERQIRVGEALYERMELAMELPQYTDAREFILQRWPGEPLPDMVLQAMTEEAQAQFITAMINDSRRDERGYTAIIDLGTDEGFNQFLDEEMATMGNPMRGGGIQNVIGMRLAGERQQQQRDSLQGPPR